MKRLILTGTNRDFPLAASAVSPAARHSSQVSPNCAAGFLYSGMKPDSAPGGTGQTQKKAKPPLGFSEAPRSPLLPHKRGAVLEVVALLLIALFMVGWLSLVLL